MTAHTCKRTGLPTSRCECHEIQPLTKQLTAAQRQHYRDREDARQKQEAADESLWIDEESERSKTI